MFKVKQQRKGASGPILLNFEEDAWIGSARECDIQVSGFFIGKRHARLYRTPGGVLLEGAGGGLGGLLVNGERVQHYGPLKATDKVLVGDSTLSVEWLEGADSRIPSKSSPRATSTNRIATDNAQLTGVQNPRTTRETAQERKTEAPNLSRSIESGRRTEGSQNEVRLRRTIHEELIKTLDLRRRDVSKMSDEDLRSETSELVTDIVEALDIPKGIDRSALCTNAVNEAIGLGPLEGLLADESVSEIMVNRHDEVYVERGGRLLRHPTVFTSDKTVLGVIERIVAPLGRRIDESSPMVDARLKDGSRVNAIIPPLAIKGPTITIRKFAKRKLGIEDLVKFGAVSEDMAEFLQICVERRKNIIVAGGTGSGKTTLLNILSNFIPDGERIITIEDAAELQLHHDHLVALETRPANVEGRGHISIRELVKNALRMRPDRIVVGECRGAEALDMLQAMNTGHEGSLTTLHANTPRDALARLETLVLMAGLDLPLPAIREQVVSAVDILVQQSRFSCGARKVTNIVEVTGLESGKVQLQELFRFEKSGGLGEDGRTKGFFTGCDTTPTFYEELRTEGLELDLGLFKRRAA